MRLDERQSESLAPNGLLHFIHLAEREGQRHGLTLEEAQDCAMDLVVRLVLWKSQNVAPEGEDGEDVLSASDEVPSTPTEAWFARCARNAAIDAYRKRQRRRETFVTLPPAGSDGDPIHVVLERCAEEHIEQLLLHLEEEPRAVFARCYLVGDSISEVAASLGKTPNAIRLILTRCRRRLRALLTPPSEPVSGSAVSLPKNNFKKSKLTRHD
jgi:RNA polymerase sigma factor (sigma-70 family)